MTVLSVRPHLRKQYRQEIDEQHERRLKNNLRIFREGLSKTGRAPEEIEALVRELEFRMRSRANGTGETTILSGG